MTVALRIAAGPLVHVSIPATIEAGRCARRAIAPSVSHLRPVQRADLLMLISELVVAMAGRGECRDDVDVDVRLDDHTLEVSVTGPGGDELDPMVASILDRLAADWARQQGSAWFRLDLSPSVADAASDERALFDRLAVGDRTARDVLFDRYRPYARSVARRYRHAGIDGEDLEQVAAVALVKSLDRFDTSRGVKFTTFAARTIDGELKRHLRDHGWSLHVPRGLQEAGLAARRAEASLAQRLARAPTLVEIADEADLAIDTVIEALAAWRSFDGVSLEGGSEDSGERRAPVDRLAEHDAALERTADRADLEDAVRALSLRDRMILYLRFCEDLSQSEIGSRVGVSQMHVSRLLTASLGRLRSRLGSAPPT